MMLLSMGFRWPVVGTMIEDLFDQALLGHDPFNAEELFDRVYGRAGYSHVPDQTKLAILSAFDLACWDIVGKYLGQPVHRLLGGRVRERVRTYTYLYAEGVEGDLGRSLRELWLDPEHAARRARDYVELGFTAVKLDPFALSISDDQALGQTVPIQFTMSALRAAEAVIGATVHPVEQLLRVEGIVSKQRLIEQVLDHGRHDRPPEAHGQQHHLPVAGYALIGVQA
jgi:galactonate dehydratase